MYVLLRTKYIPICCRQGDGYIICFQLPIISMKIAAFDENRDDSCPKQALRKNCPYSELFWSVLSCIWSEYGEIRGISPYSVQIRENTDQNNSEYEHFSRSEVVCISFFFFFYSLFYVDSHSLQQLYCITQYTNNNILLFLIGLILML